MTVLSWFQKSISGSRTTTDFYLLRGTRERATALAISLEDVQHASLQCTRTVQHWVWSVYVL